jgi:hypothetical protein
MKKKLYIILLSVLLFTVQFRVYSQLSVKYLPDSFAVKMSNNLSILNKDGFHPGLKDKFDSNSLTVSPDSPLKINATKRYHIHPVRLALVGSAITGAWLGLNLYYNQTWWKNRVHYFKFAEDPYYARDVDKLSHIYTADLITVSSSVLYEWSGFNPALSLVMGSVTALAYETYIEINDGLSPDWGYDWGDMAGNFIGALYPIAQRYVKPLRSFNIKWSFQPSWIDKKLRKYPDLLDDYTNMKFWITVNPKDLLPANIAKYYPAFLGYGLGVTLRNASHTTGTSDAYREFYLAFDIDVTKLPGNTGFLKQLKKILNFYHIPTPGIRITKGAVWYGLLF